MHEIDAIGHPAHLHNPLRSTLLADAGEEQEGSEGAHKHIGHAELPRPLQVGSVDDLTGNALPPERPTSEHTAHKQAHQSHPCTLPARPGQVHTYVVRQYQIAYKARAVPQHVVVVPEAFAPQLRAHVAVQPRHADAHGEETDKNEFLTRPAALQPRRHHRNDKVEADERIHEPQDAAHGCEVPGNGLQVGQRLLPRHSAPQ